MSSTFFKDFRNAASADINPKNNLNSILLNKEKSNEKFDVDSQADVNPSKQSNTILNRGPSR